MVFMQVGTYLFGTEFAADKGVDVLNQLRIEFIGFSPVLFGQPALLLCFFGAVLLSLDAVPLDFAADGAFVAVELFGDFGDGAVAGQVLDMVSFVLGQLCVAHGNLSCRKGRMLPHTGLFLLWKVALQMRIRRPLLFPPTGIQSKVQYLSLIQYKETVMRGIKSVALLCTLALGAPAFSAGLTKTLPGDLTTAQAQAVVQASMKKAREIKVPMNIAVMDAGGNLKAFARMDDAFIGSIDIAQKKAKTARYFNMSTRDLGKASQPGGELYGIEVTNDGLVIFPGGVLLVDKNGVIVGSVGVSGGSVDEDESVAKAGAAVLSGR